MNTQIDLSATGITTERLILRPWQESDAQDMYEYAKVEGVGEPAGWRHHESIEESREILQMFMKNKWELALVLKESGKVIGSMGIKNSWVEDDEEYLHLRAKEIGYVLSKDYWGRGLMPEAVEAIKEFCFETLKLDALTACHFLHNTRSERVIKKCGFKFVKTQEFHSKLLNDDFVDAMYICLP
ncbi:MAG: GNAT family N-acetyltransferase [Oscillospiraceae bacterium]